MPIRWRRAAAGLLAVVAVVVSAVGLAAKPGGHPRRRAVDAIIVHSLGGPDCRAGQRFFRAIEGDAQTWMDTFNGLPIVSIHYVIGRDGRVATGVPENVAATHATGWNQRSIGIELVNNGDGTDPFPSAQITALVHLVRGIRERHPAILPARILRHSDVDRSLFPAARFGAACAGFRRKLDPGDAFPWDAFRAAVSAGAADPPGSRR